ncbi:RNA polymerase sigma factor [Cochlodiniinecator piscidefendens]|uniref:RNA polymerase sigma factor n=1 Tax=Cochlodiniinecator piscidefendens TaxID=2715756 RepID=UPI00140C064A|nr:RNA polymerase sigma factor [Cochlodiniinecator piscidefendens]
MDPYQQELQDCLPDLWRYACALCRDPDIADDLVQDCAERALNKRALWRPTGPLKPWLIKMLLNLHRSERRTYIRRSKLVPVVQVPDDAPDIDRLSPALDLNDTARAMSLLPSEQREALLTVVVGGLSYKDAAKALNIPIGTLMSRLGRARASLRTSLEHSAKEDTA